MTEKSKQAGVVVGIYFILAFCLLGGMLPIYWLVVTSFKVNAQIFEMPPVWLPKPPVLAQYVWAFVREPIGKNFLNSFFIASMTTVFSITLATLAAYGFTRFTMRGSKVIVLSLLFGRMLPPIAVVIPLYLLLKIINLLDTHGGIILAHTTFNLPFAILLLRSFFFQIPTELEEAARIDGCSRLGALIRILFPLLAPGLAATAIFCFLASWNEFLLALILTYTDNAKTLPVVIAGFLTDRDIFWGPMCATASLGLVPALLITVFANKYLTRGLTLGAVKE